MFVSFSRRAIGALLLVLVCLLWVSSSELTQFIFADLAFSRPYFFTWFVTSMFQFYLVGFLVYKPWQQRFVRFTICIHAPRATPPPPPIPTSRAFCSCHMRFRAARTVFNESEDPNAVSLLNPTAQSQYGRHPSHENLRSFAPRVSHRQAIIHRHPRNFCRSLKCQK
jgi:hypothetical protein